MLNLLDNFGGFQVPDNVATVIDATVVFFVIYQLLMLIKGTRAVQTLVGLFVLIIMFFISKEEYIGLPTLNWLLDKVISSFILIIVVLFQDDIRRALTQVGRSSLITGLGQIKMTSYIEEIVRSVGMLTKQQLGAIIAIERQADLTRYTEDGIKIDAALSKEILFSSFFPEHQNPLHDGAIIVQKGRITAAGCVLSLSHNPKFDKSLGTRHRAGVGLSEETDAAVVVCSEETGKTSVAFKGHLHRNLETDELRALLQTIFSQPNPFPQSDRLSFLNRFRKIGNKSKKSKR